MLSLVCVVDPELSLVQPEQSDLEWLVSLCSDGDTIVYPLDTSIEQLHNVTLVSLPPKYHKQYVSDRVIANDLWVVVGDNCSFSDLYDCTTRLYLVVHCDQNNRYQSTIPIKWKDWRLSSNHHSQNSQPSYMIMQLNRIRYK